MIDRILVADDEYLVRQFLAEAISREGIEVISAVNVDDAMTQLRQQDVQMAFVDLKMGQTSGMDLLRFGTENCPGVLFVMVTAYGTVETAVQAMRLGAFDFLLKPVTPEQVSVLIDKARQWSHLKECQGYLCREGLPPPGPDGSSRIVGSSEAMQAMMRLATRVAPTHAAVLITGESGTGKELVAAEIHRLSAPRSDRPYIRMNCAAVPDSLLESELFGHEKGAFTGATERQIGRFELAHGGTLLLDEIGEIKPAMQAKLLRVLQESEFERVGSGKTIRVDVRVIATTNRNLKQEVERSNFREDLFYRLNVFPIHLPPLRERGGDIAEIAQALLAKQEQKLRRRLTFAPETLACLARYRWPGNVRELENVIERAAILEETEVIQRHVLPPEITGSAPSEPGAESLPDFDLRQIEKHTIRRALAHTRGNRTEAAQLLGFSVRTLRNKISQYRTDGVELANNLSPA